MTLKEKVAQITEEEGITRTQRIQIKKWYKDCIQAELDNISERKIKELAEEGKTVLEVKCEELPEELEKIVPELAREEGGMEKVENIINEAANEIPDVEGYKASCEMLGWSGEHLFIHLKEE